VEKQKYKKFGKDDLRDKKKLPKKDKTY